MGPRGNHEILEHLAEAGYLLLHLDPELQVMWICTGGARQLGHDANFVIGKDWLESFVPQAEHAEVRRAYQRINAGEIAPHESLTHSVRTRDGELRILRWHNRILHNAEGDAIGTCSLGRDVTEDETNVAAMRKHNSQLGQFRYALDESAIVAITDARGIITYVNDTFCEVSGYARDALLGKTHRVVNSGHHPRHFFKKMWQTINRGKTWRGDICNQRKSGRRYWVATTIVPLLGEDGRPEQHLAIRFEITARKEAEEAVRRANKRLLDVNRHMVEEHARLLNQEKLTSLGLLASGVAHEVNNPLAGAMNCVKMLRQPMLSGARHGTYLDAVEDALSRIGRIVRALLEYARPQASGLGSVPLDRVVGSALVLVSATLLRKRLDVEQRVDPEHMVFGDRSLVMQAFMNIFLNAIYAAPANTTIIVQSLVDETNGHLGLRVSDSGPGIPAEDLNRVCDPFYTTKPEGEGTGLGLAITTGIMEAQNGRLEIESELGRGTDVTLWMLPATAPGS